MKSLRSVILKLKTVISNSKLLLALLINGFFLLLVLLFCDMKYEVSDDFIMSTIISGVYTGRPNPHMIFVNIVLGYMLEPFYKIFPGISWYFLFQIIIIFVSFASSNFLSDKIQSKAPLRCTIPQARNTRYRQPNRKSPKTGRQAPP